jgi:hypothetical protein
MGAGAAMCSRQVWAAFNGYSSTAPTNQHQRNVSAVCIPDGRESLPVASTPIEKPVLGTMNLDDIRKIQDGEKVKRGHMQDDRQDEEVMQEPLDLETIEQSDFNDSGMKEQVK